MRDKIIEKMKDLDKEVYPYLSEWAITNPDTLIDTIAGMMPMYKNREECIGSAMAMLESDLKY